nr:tape measure protein [Actinomycetota bacterium]
MQVGELWVKLGLDRAQYDKGLAGARQDAQGFGATLKDILKQGASFALGVGLFEGIRAGLRGAIQAGIGFNAQLEQSRIAFETMLGSGTKAQTFLGELARFAARTPFQFPELVDATKRLLAFGFTADSVIPTLTAVGDAAAGLGMSGEGVNRIILALGQMKAKAKVSGEEMRQLTEAGIPAWDMLAKAMGKSTAEVMKLSENGLIPADQALKVLISGMEERFPAMMDKQSRSMLGLLSTLKDTVQMVLGDVLEGGFNRIKAGIESVLPALGQFQRILQVAGLGAALKSLIPAGVREEVLGFFKALRPTLENLKATWAGLKPIAADLWGAIKSGFAALRPILPPILNSLTALTRNIVEHWPELRPIMVGLTAAFLSFKTASASIGMVNFALKDFHKGMQLVPTATGLVSRFGTAFMELRTAPSLLTGLKGAFMAVVGVNPLLLAITVAIGLIAAGAYLVYKNWDKISAWIGGVWENVKTITVSAWDTLKGFLSANWPYIASLIMGPLGPVVVYVAKHWDAIKSKTVE